MGATLMGLFLSRYDDGGDLTIKDNQDKLLCRYGVPKNEFLRNVFDVLSLTLQISPLNMSLSLKADYLSRQAQAKTCIATFL